MPIQGIQEITKFLVGGNVSSALFEAKIFKEATKAIQRENQIRSGEVMSAFTMMMAAPRDVLDRLKVPDVFRRDVSTQSHQRVEKYKQLLSNDIIQDNGSIMVEHEMDKLVNQVEGIGLKCVHVTQLIDDQGKHKITFIIDNNLKIR